MKLVKYLTFSLLFISIFSLANVAKAGFNENVAGTDCTPAFGIAVSGQPIQAGCASYQTQQYGSIGRAYDVRLYYRNTGNNDATGVTAGIVPSSSGNFSGFLNSSAGGVSGTANLTMPANSYLEFNGAKVYQRQGNDTPVVVKQITTLAELRSFSMNNIPSYLKCASTGNSFCYQGIIVATFSVKQDQDPNPVIICNDVKAKNFGQSASCVYPQIQQPYCYDANALNRYDVGPCVYPQIQQQCVINYFTASPNQIMLGSGSNLTWATTGCTSAQIYPSINNVNVNGSQYVNPLSSTTYTLYASGVNSTSATTIISVGTPPARPICSDGIDNDGDGKVDSNDPGCYVNNVYDSSRASEYNAVINQSPSVSTLSATSITSGTCKFNAIINIPVSSLTTGYFKYGTSPSGMQFTSVKDTVGTNAGQYQFSDVVTNLNPNTTYYYRVVATNAYGTKEGEVRSCKTKTNTVVITEESAPITRTVVRQTEVRPITTTVVPDQRIVANSAPSLLFLRIDDRREDLTCSDVVDYQVVYKNVSNIVLMNAVLEVQLPAGLNYVKSSAGGTYSETTNTITFNIGQVLPGQEDAKFIQADVNCNQVDSDMLVANASMSYTNPQTTAQEEAVAYDLDKFFNSNIEGNRNGLTGAAIFGSGFLPDSLLGWLILILIILGLVYLIRLFIAPGRSNRSNRTTNTTTHTNNHNEDSDIH